jgi:hypothetical protein
MVIMTENLEAVPAASTGPVGEAQITMPLEEHPGPPAKRPVVLKGKPGRTPHTYHKHHRASVANWHGLALDGKARTGWQVAALCPMLPPRFVTAEPIRRAHAPISCVCCCLVLVRRLRLRRMVPARGPATWHATGTIQQTPSLMMASTCAC